LGQQEGFGRRGKASDTYPPRVRSQVGGNTQKTGQLFYVRKKITDEGQDHCLTILSAQSPLPSSTIQ